METIQLSTDLVSHFSIVLGNQISDLKLLAENKYCSIYCAEGSGGPVIFKQYKTSDDKLVRLEAAGIDTYHSIAMTSERLLDSRVLGYDAESRTVAIQFVPGIRLSDAVRAAGRDLSQRARCIRAMETLGGFLADLRRTTTLPETQLDPFHFEYLRHCSARLASLPGVGHYWFANAPREAEDLIRAITGTRIQCSMAHGDFVFRNLHLDGDRLGVLDFANTLKTSHPLNDICNLKQGLANMALPGDFGSALWSAFRSAYGRHDFTPSVSRFFHEFHRRRWLMLNLGAKNPGRWFRALRGMKSFASPWKPADGDIIQ